MNSEVPDTTSPPEVGKLTSMATSGYYREECTPDVVKDVVIPSLYIFICVVGLIGNGLVIWLLRKQNQVTVQGNPKLVPNLLVFNLALADFIFVGALPFWVAEGYMQNHWVLGDAGCKMFSFISLLNLYGSVFFLVAMGIDRFLAVVCVFSAREYRTRDNAIKVCIGIWIFAIIVACQGLFLRKVDLLKETENCTSIMLCHWTFSTAPEKTAYFVVRTGLGFFLPFSIIITCYVFIIISLHRRSKNTNASQSHITSKQRKVTRLILCVISLFVICWLPNHIVTLMHALDFNNIKKYEMAYKVTSCLAYANSSMNPILYAFMKEDMRTELSAMIRNCFGLKGNTATVVAHDRMKSNTKRNDKENKKCSHSIVNDECSTHASPLSSHKQVDGDSALHPVKNCPSNSNLQDDEKSENRDETKAITLHDSGSAKSLIVKYTPPEKRDKTPLL